MTAAPPETRPSTRRRRLPRALLVIAAVLGAALTAGGVLGCCALSAKPYRGPVSDHFDGERFFNREPSPHGTVLDFLRWQTTADPGPWVEWTEAPPGPPPPASVGPGAMRVTFVNHATVLIQTDGLNVLTDPIWSDRTSPFSFVGPRRKRPPGIRFEDLPPIHVVLLSHNHYDHFDLPTLRRLHDAHHPRFYTGLGNAALLEEAGISLGGGGELDWWGGADLAPGVALTSVPARHFSNRGTCDRDRTLWTGFVVKGPAGAAYFAGDTGYGAHFREIGERLGPFRLAVLPIGAYMPRWFMGAIHASPEEAVKAHHDLRAATSVAMHFGTFALADDGQTRPTDDLERHLATAGAARPRFWVLGFGEGRDVPALP